MKTAKKITVRNFKGIPTISKPYVDEEWKKLEKDIYAILTSKPPQRYLEEMYRSIENLCTYNYGSFLYENLYDLLENYIKHELLPTITRQIDFLGTINHAWVTFSRRIVLLVNVFLYLDRTYVLDNQRLLSISQINLNLFKENIVMNTLIRRNLVDGILYLISQDRQGIPVDRCLIRSVIGMLNTLQVYDTVFEVPFLHATETLYKSEGDALIKQGNLVKYLNYVDQHLVEEHKRIGHYLNAHTEVPLKDCLVNQLLRPHLKTVLSSGVHDLLENGFMEEATLLYKLVGLLPTGRAELSAAFGYYLKQRGRLIVIDPENDKSMIQDLLNFKDKVDGVVIECFESHPTYVEAVKDSFKFFINQRHNTPSGLLAKFVDGIMRSKEMGEDEIEDALQKVMVLFRFVQGKDVFEAFYKRDMAKRLLVGKSANQDAENSMISKLKAECGGGFTSRLEGMFKDITVSQGIQSAFRQHLNHLNNVDDGSNLNIDMCVNVLTNSYWPSYPTYNINLPQEMAVYQSVFHKFYMANHSGRKLLWQPNLGHCIMKAQFTQGKKELQVSLFQTIVLLLFNGSNELCYKDIRDTINLDDPEIKRTLQSLACGKNRVLLKNPKTKDVNEDDVFKLNDDFTDKLFRVKINQVQMKETVEEQKAIEETVIQDRQFQIDAAIVRIMKQNKVLSHNLLITELYDALDIPIKSADLKKRIEQLIERDYIERDLSNSNIYKYIA